MKGTLFVYGVVLWCALVPTQGFCGSESLTLEQLIRGVNEARSLVPSAELVMWVTIQHKPAEDPERIDKELEMQLADLRDQYPPLLSPTRQKRLERDQADLRRLAEQRKTGRTMPMEISAAFRIDEGGFDENHGYSYRTVVTDRREDLLDPYSEEGRWTHVGNQRVRVYDGRNLISELESRFTSIDVELTDHPTHWDFFDPQFFGIPFQPLSTHETKLIQQEAVDSVPCYVIETLSQKGRYRYWVAPEMGFSLLRQEISDPENQLHVCYTYQSAQELLNGRWFPTEIEASYYAYSGYVTRTETILVRELQVDVAFPEDYFSIDFAYLQDHEVDVATRMASSRNESPNPQARREEELKCGPMCLLRVCQVYGVEATLDELEALSGYSSSRGTSMQGLYNAGQAKRLNPRGMHLNLKQLARYAPPAILHTRKSHFVVLEKVDEANAYIYDPTEGTMQIPRQDLEAAWEGNALVFGPSEDVARHSSAKQLPTVQDAPGTYAYFSTTEYDFGMIEAGSRVEHTFTLENRGVTTLKILDIKHSCSCTVAKLDSEIVPPGKKTHISVTLTTTLEEHGRSQRSIVVYTDPGVKRTVLSLTVTVYQSIDVRPMRVMFGRFQQGALPHRQVTVSTSDPAETEFKGMRAESAFVDVSLVQSDEKRQVYQVLPARELLPGKFKDALLLDYVLRGKSMQKRIPVAGEVLGDIAAEPDRIFFGIVPVEGTAQRTVKLIRTMDSDVSVLSVNTNSDHLSTTIKPLKGNRGYELVVSLKPGRPIGEQSAHIEVITSSPSQPRVNIPVYWLTSKSGR